jgi:hypothetical protein
MCHVQSLEKDFTFLPLALFTMFSPYYGNFFKVGTIIIYLSIFHLIFGKNFQMHLNCKQENVINPKNSTMMTSKNNPL